MRIFVPEKYKNIDIVYDELGHYYVKTEPKKERKAVQKFCYQNNFKKTYENK